MLCFAHTQQHTRQAALRCPFETTEPPQRGALAPEQGCIKHGKGATRGPDLTLLNLPQDPTPQLISPLDPACDAAII